MKCLIMAKMSTNRVGMKSDKIIFWSSVGNFRSLIKFKGDVSLSFRKISPSSKTIDDDIIKPLSIWWIFRRISLITRLGFCIIIFTIRLHSVSFWYNLIHKYRLGNWIVTTPLSKIDTVAAGTQLSGMNILVLDDPILWSLW